MLSRNGIPRGQSLAVGTRPQPARRETGSAGKRRAIHPGDDAPQPILPLTGGVPGELAQPAALHVVVDPALGGLARVIELNAAVVGRVHMSVTCRRVRRQINGGWKM
ncbi:MAG: hypothetical protein JWR78_3293 [Mycobacterium sp.]|nr:hypothetical protein [Mycobacterium sp.]